MGWDPGDAEIAWMYEVLAEYPGRVAIINVHEYLLTTGGLGPIPQRIQDEVVATNPNVSMVMSGHYHDANTRYGSFDDGGDGVEDRTVTQMLFDYQGLPEGGQGLPEGGQGFLRLLQFDNEDEEIRIRTYSPSLEQCNAEHPTLEPENQDFTISYETAGIVPRVNELSADAFRAEVLTDTAIGEGRTIGVVSDVESGSVAITSWTPSDGTHGWYATASDAHGGRAYSDVWEVTFNHVRTRTTTAAPLTGQARARAAAPVTGPAPVMGRAPAGCPPPVRRSATPCSASCSYSWSVERPAG